MRITHELLPMLQQRYGLAQVKCGATVHAHVMPLSCLPTTASDDLHSQLQLHRSSSIGREGADIVLAAACRTRPGWRLVAARLLA